MASRGEAIPGPERAFRFSAGKGTLPRFREGGCAMAGESGGITTLFLDIGGVLLTNGWDRRSRRSACEKFGLNYDELNDRHNMTFGTYEDGKISLEKYLDRIVFYEPRPFSREEFKEFMFAQSQAFTETLDFFKKMKTRHRLKIATVSNEGRELTVYRINTFALHELIDVFISSCYVHFRKPDEDIYRLALDATCACPEEVLNIDDRLMFVEVARSLGIRGVQHKDLETTRRELASFGLQIEA
jgi:putative hydrolase of the HAD superfamily